MEEVDVRYEDDSSFEDSEEEEERKAKEKEIEMFTDHYVADGSEVARWVDQVVTKFAPWFDHTHFMERNRSTPPSLALTRALNPKKLRGRAGKSHTTRTHAL